MSTTDQSNMLPANVKRLDGGYESEVKYYPGKSVLGAKPAILRWKNNVISLTLPSSDDAASQQLFSVPVSQIESVGRYQTVLEFRLPSGKYKVEFSYKAGVLIGAAGGMRSAGAISAAASRQTAGRSGKALLNESGYNWWVDNLQNVGVQFKQPKLIKIVLIGLALLLVLIVLLPR